MVSEHLIHDRTSRSFDTKEVTRRRLEVDQRFHRVGLSSVVWRVVYVYQDSQGVEHATMINEAEPLDEKTLSANVLFDRTRYRLI